MKTYGFLLILVLSLFFITVAEIQAYTEEVYIYPVETYAKPDKDVDIKIIIDNIPAEGIDNLGFELLFDPKALEFTDQVYSEDLGGVLLGNNIATGVVRIGWFEYPPYQGESAELFVCFEVNKSAPDASILEINLANGGSAVFSCGKDPICYIDGFGRRARVWSDFSNYSLTGMYLDEANSDCYPSAFTGWFQLTENPGWLNFFVHGKILGCCQSCVGMGSYYMYDSFGYLDFYYDQLDGELSFWQASCQ